VSQITPDKCQENLHGVHNDPLSLSRTTGCPVCRIASVLSHFNLCKSAARADGQPVAPGTT
jgi:hypothetical protein